MVGSSRVEHCFDTVYKQRSLSFDFSCKAQATRIVNASPEREGGSESRIFIRDIPQVAYFSAAGGWVQEGRLWRVCCFGAFGSAYAARIRSYKYAGTTGSRNCALNRAVPFWQQTYSYTG